MEERYCYQGTTKNITYTHKMMIQYNVCICAYIYACKCVYVCVERERERERKRGREKFGERQVLED
jgi:hypothetical protein